MEFAQKYYPEDLAMIQGDTRDVLSVVHSKDPDQRKDMIRGLTALYDGEIDYVDSAIGELYKKLQLYKLDQNTLIIVTSDHGEEFFEHGLMEHGFTLYDEQLRVPMIFHAPAKIAKGRVINQPVSLVDLAPTLLDYAGLPIPDKLDGKSLLSLIKTEEPLPEQIAAFDDRPLHAQTTRQGPDRMCVVNKDKKYIYSPDFSLSYRRFGEEFFDLKTDPAEKTDLMNKEPELALAYKQTMLDSNMYKDKKVWHVRFAGTNDETRYNGRISTINKVIAGYKDNVIYDTDVDRKMISREFPWQKKESAIRFVAFGKDGENGFSFITDPEDAKVNFYLFIDNEEKLKNVWLGSKDRIADQMPLAFKEDIKKVAEGPPPSGYLVWSSRELVNANILLRFEVGDQIQPSAEMRERLRSLGYIGGAQ
jgi:hypothetical protein